MQQGLAATVALQTQGLTFATLLVDEQPHGKKLTLSGSGGGSSKGWEPRARWKDSNRIFLVSAPKDLRPPSSTCRFFGGSHLDDDEKTVAGIVVVAVSMD